MPLKLVVGQLGFHRAEFRRSDFTLIDSYVADDVGNEQDEEVEQGVDENESRILCKRARSSVDHVYWETDAEALASNTTSINIEDEEEDNHEEDNDEHCKRKKFRTAAAMFIDKDETKDVNESGYLIAYSYNPIDPKNNGDNLNLVMVKAVQEKLFDGMVSKKRPSTSSSANQQAPPFVVHKVSDDFDTDVRPMTTEDHDNSQRSTGSNGSEGEDKHMWADFDTTSTSVPPVVHNKKTSLSSGIPIPSLIFPEIKAAKNICLKSRPRRNDFCPVVDIVEMVDMKRISSGLTSQVGVGFTSFHVNVPVKISDQKQPRLTTPCMDK